MRSDQSVDLKYIRIHLDSPSLELHVRRTLELFGVECLDDGAEFEAYGIVDATQSVLELIKRLPGVQQIEFEGPPSGK
jgi:hypothetical protein